jgi:hypothetical protein
MGIRSCTKLLLLLLLVLLVLLVLVLLVPANQRVNRRICIWQG